MAINDFSNQNIQDTYQRVVQTDGTNRLADGTGSIFIPISSSHAITASHALFAVSASHEVTFELSSSHAVNADTASFATNFIASGDISSSGTISGSKGHFGSITLDTRLNANQVGSNGSVGNSEYGTLDGIDTSQTIQTQFDNIVNVTGSYAVTGSDVLFGNITASGNISASGVITTEDLQVDTITNVSAGGGIVLDAAGFIGLDSANGDIRFRDAGVNQLHFDMDGTVGAQVISPSVAGDDIIFKNQGGSSVLTLKSEGQTEIHGNLTASGNISASGTSFIQTPELKGTGTTTGFEVDGYVSASEFIAQGNITASGAISSSGIITGLSLHAKNTDLGSGISLFDANDNAIANLARVGSNTNAHIGRMVLRDNANVKVDIRASGNSYINGTSAKLGIGTDSPTTTLHVAGTISASNFISHTHITASGNISSSSDITANRFQINDVFVASGNNTGVVLVNHNTAPITIGKLSNPTTIIGHVTASSNISSSGTITADRVEANTYIGLPSGIVSSSDQIATPISGAFVAPSASFSTRVTANDAKVSYTDGAVLTVINDASLLSSSNQIATPISGAFVAPSASFSTRVTANDAKVSYTDAAVTSVINTAGVLSSSAQLPTGIISSSLQDLGNITGSNISASGDLIANKLILDQGDQSNPSLIFGTDTDTGIYRSGNDILALQAGGGNVEMTLTTTQIGMTTPSLNVGGAITGHITASGDISSSGAIIANTYQGTQHMLRCMSFYVNDDPLIQNSLYFGGTLGHQNSNWNDPQAVGGAISSTNSFTIVEDDMNWGIILPFDVSKIEIQCSLRPGGACTDEDFTAALYTANRSNNDNTAITLTKVAHSQTLFKQGKYVTNDFDYTADLNKGTMIYVGVGTEDSSPAAKNARGIMNITVTQR